MELGNATGFNLYLQDRAGVGQQVLQQARDKFLQLASQSPVLTRVRPNTLRDEPQYQILIDDEKARVLGISWPISTARCRSPGVGATSTTSSIVDG